MKAPWSLARTQDTRSKGCGFESRRTDSLKTSTWNKRALTVTKEKTVRLLYVYRVNFIFQYFSVWFIFQYFSLWFIFQYFSVWFIFAIHCIFQCDLFFNVIYISIFFQRDLIFFLYFSGWFHFSIFFSCWSHAVAILKSIIYGLTQLDNIFDLVI